MYCKNKSKLTREHRHNLESELEKNIRVRDNQSEENDNLNKVIHNIAYSCITELVIFQYPLPFSDSPDRKVKTTL
jgi:hypothetical protein